MNKPIDFEITNSHLRQEFNSIKHFLFKKINTKRVNIYVVLEYSNSSYKILSVACEEIENIDEDFIKSIKIERIKKLIEGITANDNDKIFYSLNEIFQLSNSEENQFKQTEDDIIEIYTSDENIRNYNEIKYLGSTLQSLEYPILFTLKPKFGFIFLAIENDKNHFIWELLNSNATYIWSIDKDYEDFESQYRKVEYQVNLIIEFGRDKYKRDIFKEELNRPIVFNSVNHQLVSNKIDEWKDQIEKILGKRNSC